LLRSSIQLVNPFIPLLIIDSTTYHVTGITTTEEVINALCNQISTDSSIWILTLSCGIVLIIIVILYVVTKWKTCAWFNTINIMFYKIDSENVRASEAVREWNERENSDPQIEISDSNDQDQVAISISISHNSNQSESSLDLETLKLEDNKEIELNDDGDDQTSQNEQEKRKNRPR